MNLKNILFITLFTLATGSTVITTSAHAASPPAITNDSLDNRPTTSGKQKSTTSNTNTIGKPVKVSYYAHQFHGRKTASGERFNMNALTVAHKTLPFGTRVEFTCASTGKKVVAKVNDRGPYVHGRSFDLSYSAAKALGILDRGVAKVTYRVLD